MGAEPGLGRAGHCRGLCRPDVRAVLSGQAAERFGRLPVLRASIAILSVFSLLAATASSFAVFALLRFLQGVGLGGETPVAATYLNEISPARLRGRMVFTLQATFALGVLSTAIAALWLIPAFGWRSMFVVGGAPLLLALLLPKLMSESPRWLALRGRLNEADGIIADAERSGPCANIPALVDNDVQGNIAPNLPANLGSLLRDGYMARTLALWAIAFCIAVAGFGVTTWMPTLYKTVYHLPIDQVLRYGLATIFASFLGALTAIPLIDLIGRKWCFGLGFAGGSIPLLILSGIAESASAFDVMLLAATANAFLALILAGIYVYAPEIYPTRMRALGAGAASAWLRFGAVVGPLLVGVILPIAGIEGVFLLLGMVALLGAGITSMYANETKGKALDTIAT